MKKGDCGFKIVLVGDSQVGKSTLLLCFVHKHFQPQLHPTIAVDFWTKAVEVKGERWRLQVWDTSGQQQVSPDPSPDTALRRLSMSRPLFSSSSLSRFTIAEPWGQ